MPRATADLSKTERHDLKSCPEGFVVLRKMTYGEIMHRRDVGANFSGQEDGNTKLQMNSSLIQEFEFATAIVDHNLEDEQGNKLDFKKPKSVLDLDPEIAQEIETLINEMNRPPDDKKVQSFRPSGTESDPVQQNTDAGSS